MALPHFVAFPPQQIRTLLLPEEWEACLESWILLAQGYLSMDWKLFVSRASSNQSLVDLLLSYVRETSNKDVRVSSKQEKILRYRAFLLTHRLLSEVEPPPSPLLSSAFLGDFCTVYAGSSALRSLLNELWETYKLGESPLMLKDRAIFLRLLEETMVPEMANLDIYLRRAAALLKVCPQYGRFLMTGSEVLDSIAAAWSREDETVRKKFISITYLSLSTLLQGDSPNVSLLLDHLYSLKASTERNRAASPNASLLSQLVSTTPFLHKLQKYFAGNDAARAKPLTSYLESLQSGQVRPKRRIRQKVDKGKGIERDEYGRGALGESHVHKMSLITQIQDLFPDLGSGFIIKLLDEYGDDAERVTAHLLDDSLPSHLKIADRKEIINNVSHYNFDLVPSLAPHSTPPLLPIRKNIFDNDAFDNLAVDASKIHIGRKNADLTADDLLADRSSGPNKAAILSALAAFDSDDDERDDTYDVEDVGGTVDTVTPGSDEVDADLRDKNEEALFSAYKMSPAVFDRDANTRRGKGRVALRSETGMTDEAIEGWAIMLGRDPRRLRRLEVKLSMAAGGQRELASMAFREGGADSGTEGEGGEGELGDRGGFRGRGMGRRRGRGGNVAGPAGDKATQVARQRKDANKGSRANHSRRDQRARKVARAGFPG